MGLSGEIIVGGLPLTMRPSFETLRALQRLKVVPTTFQPHLAGDCGVWHGMEPIARTFSESFGIY
jgi:hypothetical protein